MRHEGDELRVRSSRRGGPIEAHDHVTVSKSGSCRGPLGDYVVRQMLQRGLVRLW